MPRPPVPRAGAPVAEPVIVVPEAGDLPRTDALLGLARWFAERGRAPTVLCWQTGTRVGDFARIAPVIDAGAVNEELPARVLAGIGLAPLGRALKSHRLRRRLAPIATADRLVLGGVATAALLEWLPPRPRRAVAVWVGDDELDRAEEAVAVGTSFLVSGEAARDALVAQGATSSTIREVGEPLLTGAPAPVSPPTHTGRPPARLALLGAGVGEDAAISGLIAAVLASSGLPRPAVAWVHPDGDRAWSRWADPRWAGFEADVADWTAEEARRHLDEVLAVVVAGPTDLRLAVEAAAQSVPVVALRPVGIEAVVVAADEAELLALLTTLVADAGARAAAAALARDRAAHHRIDHVGAAVQAALGMQP